MTVPARPATYRNPRFGILHEMRRLGTSSFSHDFSGGEPDRILIDNLQGEQLTSDGVALSQVQVFDRSVSPPTPAIDTLVVLGINWYNVTWFKLQAGDPVIEPMVYGNSNGAEIIESGMPGPIHWIDRLGTVDPLTGLGNSESQLLMTAAICNAQITLGEMIWTLMEEVDTGISTGWSWTAEGNLLESDTEASEAFTLQRGDPRQVYSLQQQMMEPSTAFFFQRLRDARDAGQPVVYQPPDSGDALVPRMLGDDITEWIAFPGVLTTSPTGHDPAGQNALRMTASGVGVQTVLVNPPTAMFPDGVEDWRGLWLRFDFKPAADGTWQTLASSLQIELQTAPPSVPQSPETTITYDLGTPFVNTPVSGGDWMRVYVDLEDASVISAGAQGDLKYVSNFAFRFTSTVDAQIVDFGDIYLIDPRKGPRLVRIQTLQLSQDSPSPAQDPTYSVNMTMRELLS